MTRDSFYQKPCGIHFNDCPFPAYHRNIGMRESMVTYFMPFTINSFYNGNIIFRIDTNHEKSSRYIFSAQDVQNLRCIKRIGSIVKSEHQFFLILRSIFSRNPFGWKAIISFFRNQQFGCIQFRRDFSTCRTSDYIQHFTFAGISRCFIQDSWFSQWRINENQNCADCPCSYPCHKNPTYGDLHYQGARERPRPIRSLPRNAWN